ncbi:neural cell adhesion molecule 1 [Patella vulgata]|uniref:neural cell adhesion molecule 1 n=1 Tax=Patella vulgata TaxID=6465 RepID=UPI00217F83FC|nr:neural cell adhesion molecule 1 [Patella vulgata]
MSLWHATALILFLYIYFSYTGGQFLTSQQPYAIRGETFTWVCDIRGQQNPENVVFIKFRSRRSDTLSICTVKINECSSRRSRYSRYNCGCINNDTSSLYLTLTNIQADDEGKWACKQSSNTVYPVYLPVYYGPENVRFRYNTRDGLGFTEGEDSTLTCNADCEPQCNIRLYNKTINTSEPSSVNKNQLLSSNGSLSLVNISRDINGSAIICQAVHPNFSGTSVTAEIKLKVYYVARNIVFSTTDNETVIEGQDVNITCYSSDGCYPPCTFIWHHDSPYSYYYNYHRHRSNSDIAILSMKRVNRERSGVYKCEARQSQRPGLHKYRELTLTVYYPPKIEYLKSDAPNEIDEGSSVTLFCSVDSVPDSSISWSRSKESQLPTTGSKLFIPIATCGHADDYTCTADNGVGQPSTKTISVYVRCLPRIDQNQTTNGKGVPVIVGDDKTAVLTIHVIAYPLPTFKWYRLYSTGIEKPLTDFSIKQTDTLLSSTLTIEDFTVEDNGYYKVYVENSIGVRSHVFLVSYKPII